MTLPVDPASGPLRASLLDSEIGFRALVEGVVDYAIYMLDPQGIVVTWNAGAERIKGYRADEILGSHFSTFYTDDDRREGLPEQALQTAAVRGSFHGEGWRRRKSGSAFWASIVINALYDGEGRRIGFAKITRDLTERAEEDEQRRLILDATPAGILIVDDQGLITFANASVERTFGYDAGALIGLPVETLVPDAFRAHPPYLRAGFSSVDERPMALSRQVAGRHHLGHAVALEIQLKRIETRRGRSVIASILDVTEKHRAESVLRESEERFRGAFETAPHGMALVSTEGRWLRMNAAVCRMLGYSEQELLASDFQTITHPEDLEADLAEVQALLAGETSGYQMEKRYFHKNGSIVWTILSVSLVRGLAGEPLYFVSQIQDVTDRKRVEVALQESEAKYRALVEDQTEMISLARPDGQLLFVNTAYAEFFGTTAERMVGTSLFDYVAETDREAVAAHLRNVIASRTIIRGENRSVSPDGSLRWVMWTNRVILGSDGTTATVHSVGRDITERKLAEQALQESEERYRVLYVRTPAMMHSIDEAGRLLNVSDHWLSTLGYHRDEVIGRNSVEFLTPKSRDYAEKIVLPAFRVEGSCNNVPYQFVRKDGSVIDILMSAVSEKDASGRVVRSLAVLTDVSERNQAQAALELAHADAVRARAEAEAATRSKSQFLANMSHEIRTPMNGIMGLTRLALETRPTPKQENYLRKIDRAATALLSVLNDILDYSKIEAGKLSIESVPFDLEETLQGVVQLFLPAAEEKGIDLFVDIARDVPSALIGDPLRLSQVLNNLVGNAVKFTERGEIRLSIALAERLRDTAVLRVAIRDTGIGLSEVQADQLFHSFTQADSSITRRFGGSGLGLAICRHLVGLMGGDISVSSVLGQGSVFAFTVAVGVARQQPAPIGLNDLRILVVDDQETSRAILGELLDSWHARVTTTKDESGALAAIEQAAQEGDPFRLLLFDWKMSGMNGRDPAARLSGLAGRPTDLRTILMLSAHERDRLDDGALEFRPAGVIVKPIVPSTLQEAILTALDPGRRGRFPTPRHPDETSPADLLQPLKGAKVLLVEDNALNQEVARETLENAGLRVEIANDGAQAVERALRGGFDAILMDLHMPRMDGLRAARIIRGTTHGQSVPIIAMSAAAMERDKEACLAAGMNAHLAKPIVVRDLAETLLRHVKPPAAGTKPSARPMTAAGSAGSAAFPEIPGIDSADAARRLGGNAEKFIKFLNLFLSQFAGVASVLRDDIDAGRLQQAQTTLHTFRGVAGNLSVTGIAALAGQMETALKEDRVATARALLPQLEASLNALVAAVPSAD